MIETFFNIFVYLFWIIIILYALISVSGNNKNKSYRRSYSYQTKRSHPVREYYYNDREPVDYSG
ncbi:MAG: hypothetical protein IAE65_06270 [Ignavibacteria bacterium]|nr:hypothetical protein [Ignavibacteria bacterium]